MSWEDYVRDWPSLKGMKIGKTDINGQIVFMPYASFRFRWSAVEFKEPGWEGEIVRSQVKGEYYEFEVRWTKKGRGSFNKIYQIGSWQKKLFGRDKHIGEEKNALDIDGQMGLRKIGEIVRGEKQFKDVGDLTGLGLGKTNSNGEISFNPYENFTFSWTVLRFAESGWEGEIIRSQVKGEYYEFEVRWTKKGRGSFNKIYQIGSWERKLRATSKIKGSLKNVLDISDRLGQDAIKEIITGEKQFEEIGDLTGLIVGKTTLGGTISFTPYENFEFHWSALGLRGEGWEGEIVRSGVKGQYFEFEVRWKKQGKLSFNKVYQIGVWERKLLGEGKAKGDIRKILDINDRLGLRAIGEIIRKEREFKDVLDLTGLRIGKTDSNGTINFSPYEKFPFYWPALGLNDGDWEGGIIRSGVVKGKYFEFEVRWSKGKQIFNRIYQIGPWERKLLGKGKFAGGVREVLDIDSRLGLQAIGEIIREEKKFEEVADLTGLRIGKTNSAGKISWDVYGHFQFNWPALGFHGADWEGEIIRSGLKGKYFELQVRWSKEGEKSFNKVYQIGVPWKRKLLGMDNARGQAKEVLDIDERLGLQAIGEIIRKEREFKDVLDLTGLRIGKTDSGGNINFSPYENFPFSWPALGFYDADWEGEIIGSDVEGGMFQFVVKFSKNEQELTRWFMISHFPRQLKGHDLKRSKSKIILNIFEKQNLEKLLIKQGIEPKFGYEGIEESRRRVSVVQENPEDLTRYEMMIDRIYKAMREMSKEEQGVATMIVDGYEDEEIIKELGFDENVIQGVRIKLQQALKDFALLAQGDKGGIDLTPSNMNLQTQNNGGGIKFHLDPAMLQQLQNAPGFVPVIINIQPMTDLREFLGLNQSQTSTQLAAAT